MKTNFVVIFGAALFLVLSTILPVLTASVPQNGRERREISSILSDLASQFFSRGGQRGVDELSSSNDQSGVLQRYLGSAIAGMVFGNGNDLVSQILGSWGGSSSSSSSSGGYRPSASGGSRSSGSASSGGYSNSNSRTGVSVVDSHPDRPRRPSSSGSTGSGSGTDDTNTGRRRPSGTGNRGSDFDPLPGSNSKTGVSVINSRPGDRRPSSSSSGASSSAGSRNPDVADYDVDAGSDGSRQDGNAGRSRNTDTERTGSGRGYGRYSGNRRDDSN
ncbi:protein rtoA-like [Paramacrobiotus metropolitanus]|uniref:protein rtoA-like n=1 Tax=Paramacrobiotus metropolitanus TaxID=2943436 RepID=UPI0024459488|nr:protein rtoA-like [Paramacrobiotus metropolitanus]XP_055342117.1 protein rtoA-like [Paramacrobiotus metropolitanus]